MEKKLSKIEKKVLIKDTLKNTLIDIGYCSLHLIPTTVTLGVMGAVGGAVSGDGAFNGAKDILINFGKYMVAPALTIRATWTIGYSIVKRDAGEKPQLEDYGDGI